MPELSIRLAGLALTAMTLAAPAMAQDATILVGSKGCNGCHAVDTQKLGPAFKSIATRYAGNAGAETKLIGELKSGAAHPKVSATDDELKAMVDYILALK